MRQALELFAVFVGIGALAAIALWLRWAVKAAGLDTWPGRDRSCRFCGCTDLNACIDGDGHACYWVAPDVCSECRERV